MSGKTLAEIEALDAEASALIKERYQYQGIVIPKSDAAIAADLKDRLRKALEACCRVYDEATKAGIVLQAQTAYVEAIGRHEVVVLNAHKKL